MTDSFRWLRAWRLAGAVALALHLGQSAAQTAAPGTTPGRPAAAELRSVSGVVFAQSGTAEPRVLQTGAKLFVGDTVGTQKGAFALLVFNDGSRVALRPESAMVIRGFSFKPEDPASDQMSVQLLKGWLRNVSGQIGKRGNPASFEMKVVDSTIGIRGTDFAVRYCDAECAAAPAVDTEGVLPQSGRLGQILSSNQPLERLREGAPPEVIEAGAVLRLGDVVGSTGSEALLGLDDGTRLVLAPGTRLAMRAEEDERGRRALRLDLLQGTLRVATPPQPGARLYGLLIDAGQLLGIRQNAAMDLVCEVPAQPGGLTCPAASVTLRRGQAEVLSSEGLRSLRPGVTERLSDPPSAQPAAPRSSLPSGFMATLPFAPDRDPWGFGARMIGVASSSWGTDSTRWGDARGARDWYDDRLMAQATSPAGPVLPPIGAPTGGLFDPVDLPVEAARPSIVGARATEGIYTAVFSGTIEVRNPNGSVVVPVGQGAFVPPAPTLPPQLLPAAPLFMERDRELDRGRLLPGQCTR